VVDEACHDDQTEVMTEFGWRHFMELDGSERLLTMDPDTHEASYVRPQKLVAKAYTGPMYEYAATGGNFCVTPDHDLYWHGRSHNRDTHWRKARADESTSRIDRYMMKSIQWDVPDVSHHVIPELVLERKHFPALQVDMDDWMIFLGWYCSEGSVIRRPDGPRGIVISQRNTANMDDIEAVVQRLGFTYRRYQHDLRIGSTQLAQHLALLGRSCLRKAPPTYARMTSARQIGLFLNAFAKGDGYGKGSGEIIYTSSPVMADALQEMILKTGVPSVVRRRPLSGVRSQLKTHIATSTVDGYVVTRSGRSSELKMRAGQMKIVDYNGMVYCASVPPNALLFTRRNGYTLWSGNCGVPKSIFDAVDALATNSNARVLAIGNPDDPSSHFAQICKPGSGWHVIKVSAFDTPAYTGEQVPPELLPLLISPEWVEERKLRWASTVRSTSPRCWVSSPTSLTTR
jgi:replicative DNA helicase Mcm